MLCSGTTVHGQQSGKKTKNIGHVLLIEEETVYYQPSTTTYTLCLRLNYTRILLFMVLVDSVVSSSHEPVMSQSLSQSSDTGHSQDVVVVVVVARRDPRRPDEWMSQSETRPRGRSVYGVLTVTTVPCVSLCLRPVQSECTLIQTRVWIHMVYDLTCCRVRPRRRTRHSTTTTTGRRALSDRRAGEDRWGRWGEGTAWRASTTTTPPPLPPPPPRGAPRASLQSDQSFRPWRTSTYYNIRPCSIDSRLTCRQCSWTSDFPGGLLSIMKCRIETGSQYPSH